METQNSNRRHMASSMSSASYVSQKVDPQALIDHSVKLQNWICDKALRSIQAKANLEIKKSNEEVEEIMERENTFVKEVDEIITQKSIADRRRQEQLNKRWNRVVFTPLNDKIQDVMDGGGLQNLQKRKRELHQEYIDIVNRRESGVIELAKAFIVEGPASLDVYSEDDYYPFGLHGTRPSHLKVHIRYLDDDPTLIHERQQNSEHRVLLRCQTGTEYSDKDLQFIRLPPLPLVPLGRQGTTCKTWEYLPFHDINSDIRRRSRQRMRPDFNYSQFKLSCDRSLGDRKRETKSAPHLSMVAVRE